MVHANCDIVAEWKTAAASQVQDLADDSEIRSNGHYLTGNTIPRGALPNSSCVAAGAPHMTNYSLVSNAARVGNEFVLIVRKSDLAFNG